MSNNANYQIALTFDDAPSIKEAGIVFDPERMERVRALLVDNNIEHSTAFVVGDWVSGNEQYFEKWLESGFELANHTHRHLKCSELTIEKFEKDVTDCDKVLTKLGAFNNGREKWFRFPYMDRGKDPDQRKAFRDIVNSLNYRVAHASLDFFDHQYESCFQQNVDLKNELEVSKVADRFLSTVSSTTNHVDSKSKYISKTIPHISFMHFGLVSDRCLHRMLKTLLLDKVNFCSLKNASSHRVYSEFEDDYSRNGLALDIHTLDGFTEKLLRKIIRLTVKTGLFSQDKYGPKWPYLSS